MHTGIVRLLHHCLLTMVLITSPLHADNEPTPAPWLQVIRDTPYVFSDGFYQNISIIRRWVLLEQSYCEQPDRHILFDQRGRFLTWFENEASVAENQERLNRIREQLYRDERVHRWVGGAASETGYPFALRCDQPHVDLNAAIDRLLGTEQEDRVWGTWDGMVAGSEQNPIPLIDLVQQVFQDKAERQGFDPGDAVVQAFVGQILIESGARKESFSAAQAVGLLQLRPEVLGDCEIAERFHLHRMAQVDCAVRLYQQNDRNLRPVFERRFGHLPDAQREQLYSLLLVQAYHGGIGRMMQLLGEDEPGAAARQFARDAERYSAEDIALGLVFHNMGRISLGLDSLYYLVDVSIATEAACTARPDACEPVTSATQSTSSDPVQSD
ncbi:hypothetical protein [Saccharospirillum impatiens]|uniref:hypothetical protein n=1 Tax=Saccharospirillum impatiens TaxID=169438 RepID=UPI000427D2CE|nr:hypothetical protein [Saccharospirillum impatiens]